MIASLLRYRCPFCSEPVVHVAARGPIPCPHCFRNVNPEDALGYPAVPTWIWGVVVAMAACLVL